MYFQWFLESSCACVCVCVCVCVCRGTQHWPACLIQTAVHQSDGKKVLDLSEADSFFLWDNVPCRFMGSVSQTASYLLPTLPLARVPISKQHMSHPHPPGQK